MSLARRRFLPVSIAAGSLALLGGLVILLSRDSRPPSPTRPLVVLCAAALRPAMEATAADYEREDGGRVEFRFGNSAHALAAADLTRDGDLFLPADDSYVRAAGAKGLVAAVHPLARMRVVVLARPGNPRGIARFADLLDPGLKLGQANPDGAAVGKVTRDHLTRAGTWDALRANTRVLHTTVTEAANAVQLGSDDAALVWDAVAANYLGRAGETDLAVVRLPELDGAIGRVELAVLTTAADPEAARRFARFVASPAGGQRRFRAAGFTDLEPGPAGDP